MIYEINMGDIQDYLATKGDDEVIGECLNGDACLAHNTLTWKYGLEDSDVLALSYHAWVSNNGSLDFPEDVVHAVHTFDNLKSPGSLVKKAEFMAAMGGDSGQNA